MFTKRIIILSELDELSAKVTGFAAVLADQMNISKIVLLNLLIPVNTEAFFAAGDIFSGDGHLTNRINSVLFERHQKLAEEEAERFTTDKVKIEPCVRFSESKTNLNKFMQEFKAGLVVCGSYDSHNFSQMLFGSVTGEIVRKVDYPIIIIHDETVAAEIKSILVAIDIKQKEQRSLSEIVAFAGSVNARMQLLHVLTEDSQSSDKAIKKLHKLAIENKFDNYDINVVNNDSLEDGIRSFARKHNPDMIAVMSQGKGKIHKLIFGSSTEDIIKEIDKPVFICKIK